MQTSELRLEPTEEGVLKLLLRIQETCWCLQKAAQIHKGMVSTKNRSEEHSYRPDMPIKNV